MATSWQEFSFPSTVTGVMNIFKEIYNWREEGCMCVWERERICLCVSEFTWRQEELATLSSPEFHSQGTFSTACTLISSLAHCRELYCKAYDIISQCSSLASTLVIRFFLALVRLASTWDFLTIYLIANWQQILGNSTLVFGWIFSIDIVYLNYWHFLRIWKISG